MKQYNTPEMELIKFQVNDVLAASEGGSGGGGFNPDAQEGNGWNAGPDQFTGYDLG